MADSFRIKPAAGKAVRDPRTMKLLADGGEEKPRNSYWLRRLAAGDVETVKVITTSKKSTSTSEDA